MPSSESTLASVRTILPSHPIDLRGSLAPLQRGTGDPCLRLSGREVWWASRTPAGTAMLHLWAAGGRFEAQAWGDGARWMLDQAPALIGCDDDAEGFDPTLHPFVTEMHHRFPGLRIGRTDAVFEAVLPAICEQKVTGFEAHRSWRGLVHRYGDPAPGPHGLRVPPSGDTMATVPAYELHKLGLERKRADTIRRVAARSRRLQPLTERPTELTAHLTSIPGVGAWTAAEVCRVALGDPDAVSVGDYHLPTQVCLALSGESNGTDERMLELLEPFRGHRARVVQLILASGVGPARRGPRRAPHSIATI